MTPAQSPGAVSWLKLERYHLGELAPDEARDVERAIAEDPATRECFELIQRPISLKPLRTEAAPIHELRPQPEPPGRPRALRDIVLSPWALAAVAAAASVVLFVASGRDESARGIPPSVTRIKGGDVALELVRERSGVVTKRPKTFRDGDRFKVLLTCPPAMHERFAVVVFQDKEVFRPLSPEGVVACGNGVAIDGALSLTGRTPTTICVAWGKAAAEGAPERGGIASVRGSAVCIKLDAE